MHSPRFGLALSAIYSVAFLLRLFAGLSQGPDFLDDGYSFYADIARTLISGGGFCMSPNFECAVRTPLYPLIIAPFIATGSAYPWLIVVQALIGAASAVLLFVVGRQLFNAPVGLGAAAVAAVNPYAIIHGPAFQDTVVVNALFTLALALLLTAIRDARVEWAIAASGALGLMVLTSARMLPVALVAVAWAVFEYRGRFRLQSAAIIPLVLLLGGWSARNAYVVGAPVLTTEAGLSLWVAHNDVVASVIPQRSIDEVEDRLRGRMSRDAVFNIDRLMHRPVERDRAFAALAIDYMRTHPIETLAAAVKKIAVSFGGWLSPARSWPIQLAYALLFAPLNILAAVGLWRSLKQGPPHALVALIVAAFLVTTAMFWAHTSHRSFLHGLKIVYAVSVALPLLERTGWAPRWRPRST